MYNQKTLSKGDYPLHSELAASHPLKSSRRSIILRFLEEEEILLQDGSINSHLTVSILLVCHMDFELVSLNSVEGNSSK